MQFKIKNQIANALTLTRIILSVPLLFSKTFSVPFYVFYLICGFTDMIDGTIARKTHSDSKFGEKLDSVADFTFVVVCLIKIIPSLILKMIFWIWIGIIALIKIINVVIGLILQKKLIFLHTIPNKITGFCLFLLPLTVLFIPLEYSVIFCSLIATFAAIHEGICIIKMSSNK